MSKFLMAAAIFSISSAAWAESYNFVSRSTKGIISANMTYEVCRLAATEALQKGAETCTGDSGLRGKVVSVGNRTIVLDGPYCTAAVTITCATNLP